MILHDGFPTPRRSLGIFSRLPPSALALCSRIKYELFGPRRAVDLKTSILQFELPPETIELSLGKPEFADTNGLRIWILKTNDLHAAYLDATRLSEIRLLGAPALRTLHGVPASISATKTVSIHGAQNAVGLTLDCLPYVRRDWIDLALRLTITEVASNDVSHSFVVTNSISIQTNSLHALRMQIPNGSGAFILHETANHSAGTGVFISPSSPPAKK